MDRTAALAQLNQELFALPLPEGVIQVVPGEGDPCAPVVFVGHAPGSTDNESGRPYSGPAGELLNQLLAEAGIQRHELYVTNLVKVWTWKQEDGIRMNRTPGAGEIKAWSKVLKVELELIRPQALVCLGGPTAQHFLGREFKITQSAGQWQPWPERSPYLKIVAQSAVQPVVMGIPQPNYLIHLQQHAPESYPDARANMVANLIRVKRFMEQKSVELPAVSRQQAP